MNTNAQYAATVLRLSLGIMYLAHGLLKLIIFTPEGTSGFFASIGLPAFFGPLTMVVEIGAGIALILGFYSRWISIALIPLLLGSILLVHGASGWLFSNQGGGWEYPAFLIAASVAQFLLGDGAFALKRSGSTATQVA